MAAARILIIDDDFEVLAALRDIVASLGYEVQTAESGGMGLTMAQRFQPDIVLLDLAMPTPSGWEVLGRLRHDHPRIRVIMVASQVEAAISEGLLARGAFAYVDKPFSIAHIEAVIRAALSGPPPAITTDMLRRELAAAVQGPHRPPCPADRRGGGQDPRRAAAPRR